jgi:hypothetical protein
MGTVEDGSPYNVYRNNIPINQGDTITVSLSFPGSTNVIFVVTFNGTSSARLTSNPSTFTQTATTNTTLRVFGGALGGTGPFTYALQVTGPGCISGIKFFDPGDDRLNRDPGQPAALYCRNQGDVHIYAVNPDDSKGKLALVVAKAEIDAVVNANPSANTLIKQSADGKFKLFYLPVAKELSFITHEIPSGKQYSFVWNGLCR